MLSFFVSKLLPSIPNAAAVEAVVVVVVVAVLGSVPVARCRRVGAMSTFETTISLWTVPELKRECPGYRMNSAILDLQRAVESGEKADI